MTDMQPQDISDEPRGFSVDEIIERNAAAEDTPPMFGVVFESAEELIRLKHVEAANEIERLVNDRAAINEIIKGLRTDLAILESAVARYDRIASDNQQTLEFVEVLQADEEVTVLDVGV